MKLKIRKNHKIKYGNILSLLLFMYLITSLMRDFRIIDPLSQFGRLSRYSILAVFAYLAVLSLILKSKIIIRYIKVYRIYFLNIGVLLVSLLFNLEFAKDYLAYITLMVFSLTSSLIIKDKHRDIILKVYFIAGLYTIYAVFISKDVHISPSSRDVLMFDVNRVRLGIEGISFSLIATMMGTYSILWFGKFNNQILKYSGFLLFIALSIALGKITIIISLFLSLAFYFVLVLFKSRSKLIINFTLLGTAFSSFIITKMLIPISGISANSADEIFNSRITIWNDYINKLFDGSFTKVFFGRGFFDATKSNPFIIFHPHNQFLGSFYIVGLVGLIAYILLWKDVLNKSYTKAVNEKDFRELMLLVFILFIQIGDDYILYTMEPLYLMIITSVYVTSKEYDCNHNKNSKLKKKKNEYKCGDRSGTD